MSFVISFTSKSQSIASQQCLLKGTLRLVDCPVALITQRPRRPGAKKKNTVLRKLMFYK
jgi:hypothetical protein